MDMNFLAIIIAIIIFITSGKTNGSIIAMIIFNELVVVSYTKPYQIVAIV